MTAVATVVVTDDFNRADETPLAAPWFAFTGQTLGNLVSNHAENAGDVDVVNRFYNSTDLGDDNNWAEIDVTFNSAAGYQSAGVWCRFTKGATDDGYRLRWQTSGSLKLYQYVAGSSTEIAATTVSGTGTHTLRIEAYGTLIRGYFDGVKVLSVTNSAVTTGVNAGVSCQMGTGADRIIIDNFSAGTLPSRRFWHKKPLRSAPEETATWDEVQVGEGNLSTARRICDPPDSQYPNASGMSFYKDGVFDRTDLTGPRDNSRFHFYDVTLGRPVDLVGGEVLLATWTDENGVPRSSTYNVPVPSLTPTASGVINVNGSAVGAVLPSASGWPDASNTGPSGALTTYSGTYNVTTNNAVVQNLHIVGKLDINANNVTIRNCKITNTTNAYVVTIGSGRTGLLIEDCEIDGNLYSTHGIVFNNYTIRRTEVHRCGDGLNIGANTTVEDCYIHDLGMSAAGIALNTPSRAPHYDGIQMPAGSSVVIRHNTIEGKYRTQTSAIYISAWAGPISNMLIENNKLSGGGYTLYVVQSTYGVVSPGITVRNNTFVRYSSTYGPIADSNFPMQPHPQLFFSGNVFDTGGAVYPGMGYDTPPA